MKTIKSMLAGITLLLAFVTFNASAKTHTSQPTQTDVVNIYISAVSNGKVTDLNKVLDNEMHFNIMRGTNTNTMDKNELLDYLKNNTVAGVTVNTTTTVLSNDDGSAKVKVEFKYDGYTRIDILTLDKTLGWKITNVDSSNK